jgi:hypothetical protein
MLTLLFAMLASQVDPNVLDLRGKDWPDKPFSSTITMGRFSRTIATWHPCGCMDAPLAQGRIFLPCKDHEKSFLRIVQVAPSYH